MNDFRRNTLFILASVFFFLLIVDLLNITVPVRVTNSNVSAELSVVGEGKVDVVPDTATINAGITVDNLQTQEQAKQEMTKVNNAIIEAVKTLDVKKEDIKTSNFAIYPAYNNGSRISGYSGNADVTIKVRNKDRAAQVVDSVTKAGATNVYGPQFTVERPEKFREEARKKAIKNAKEQANKLAKELGIRLGRVTNIVESTGPVPNRFYGVGGMTLNESAIKQSPVFEEGTQTITSTVTLYFEKR